MSQLTVKELIDLLAVQPQDAAILIEGCDCCGEADGVRFDEQDQTLLITRAPDTKLDEEAAILDYNS